MRPTTRHALHVESGHEVPSIPDSDIPVDPARSSLYSPGELYAELLAGGTYDETLDARTYVWSRLPRTPQCALAQALHDHAVDQALAAWVAGRRLAGVMGGHAITRGSADYADACQLGRTLAGTAVVATGGGPGAMEAANLGAYLAGADSSVVDDALGRLARVPSFASGIGAWAQAALDVAGATSGAASLGIPTWHYGHEPPNVFATTIAKYFRNATREAILLEICDAGIVFLPGAGGTVQEVFQDACENYYAEDDTVAPMVLVGRSYWTDTLPAWPLLRRLARGRAMEPHIHLVDDVDQAGAIIAGSRG